MLQTCLFFIIFSGSAVQRWLWPPRPRVFLITNIDAPQSVGLLWTSDQLVAETHNRQTSMFPVGFEPTITVGDLPQTHALDCAATGTGEYRHNKP
jgi:hypothetical protein